MISGTIIGEIMIAMIRPLNGTWLCESPTAASVPRPTEISVATGAIISELRRASCQSGLVKKSR